MFQSIDPPPPINSKDELTLKDQLPQKVIVEFYEIFKKSNDEISKSDLRTMLAKHGIWYTDENFDIISLKINTDKNSNFSWDEFISFLQHEYESVYFRQHQDDELWDPIYITPIIRNSRHRNSILRIALGCDISYFNRKMLPDSIFYITASRDGMLSYISTDFNFLKTEKSTNSHLKVTQSWILDVVTMPDLRIICISSVECDLRFYDTSANKFALRMEITEFPFAITKMIYTFNSNEGEPSNLVIGDMIGNVRILQIESWLRGPFQNKLGQTIITAKYTKILKNLIPLIHMTEFLGLHSDKICDLYYSPTDQNIISAAECPNVANPKLMGNAVVVTNLGVTKFQRFLKLNRGVTCFVYQPHSYVLITGGPDTFIRFWNPLSSNKSDKFLSGHHAGIVYIFVQDLIRIYSLDKNKVLKVWNSLEMVLLQTFTDLCNILPSAIPLACYYNDLTRELIVASTKIVAIKCSPIQNLKLSDGVSHTKGVSVILYNKLFKCLITCGHDSFIMVWDPWNGKRLQLIKNAHTIKTQGIVISFEITAACFNPSDQLLLTGARNGSLKIWNFNNGVCIRNLSIEDMCEVTAVFWITDRILATGWNRHVTEFADTDVIEYGSGKFWETHHHEDIMCAAIRYPQTLATSSYDGTLYFWKLETGQPYCHIDINEPTNKIKMSYATKQISFENRSESSNISNSSSNNLCNDSYSNDLHKNPQAMIFLENRSLAIDCGTLFVAINNGTIQVYSHHKLGGFITQFLASHVTDDCVISMITDKENNFLFVGTVKGFVNIWLMNNYCIPGNSKTELNCDTLEKDFPSYKTINEQFNLNENNTKPMLLNSFKGHLCSIAVVHLIEISKILITGSNDCSIRLWTYSGNYLGTLGSPSNWNCIPVSGYLTVKSSEKNIPTDIKRLQGRVGVIKKSLCIDENDETTKLLDKSDDALDESEMKKVMKSCLHGKPLSDPILGKNFKLPKRPEPAVKPILDKSFPYIPVYSHLKLYEMKPVAVPEIPEILTNKSKNILICKDTLSKNINCDM